MPAPPPKTNPWKKPVVDKAVTEKSSKPSSDAKPIDAAAVTEKTEKVKPEKTTKVKPSTGESKHQQQAVSKSNPWKKLEKSSKAVDEEVGGGGEAGEDERKGEKGSSTWPTLALKPSKKKKEGEEVSSVEEGKENQVRQLPFLELSFTIPTYFQDTSNINNNHLKSINNNNMNNSDDSKKRRRKGRGVGKFMDLFLFAVSTIASCAGQNL